MLTQLLPDDGIFPNAAHFKNTQSGGNMLLVDYVDELYVSPYYAQEFLWYRQCKYFMGAGICLFVYMHAHL